MIRENDEVLVVILNDFREGADQILKKYNIIGIITDNLESFAEIRETNSIEIYDFGIITGLNKKVIILDFSWHNKARLLFRDFFEKHGLRLGIDYIYASLLEAKIDTNLIFELVNNDKIAFEKIMKKIIDNRKFVMIHGNCQSHVLVNMLISNEEFTRKYVTYVMPRIWEAQEIEFWSCMIESDVFQFAEILLSQKIANDNEFGYKYSTEYVKSLLTENCKIILYSNLWFTGYFPQYLKVNSLDNLNFNKYKILGSTKYSDKNVLKMIAQGKNDDEIIAAIEEPDFYRKEELYENIESELNEFAVRENGIDIKMCDYIRENYQKIITFVTFNHPTRDVLMELTRRILKKLGIEQLNINCPDDEIQYPMPQNWRYLIYPSVLRELGIERNIEYSFRAIFTEEELKLLEGMEKVNIVQRAKGLYEVEVLGGFDVYMKMYVRCVRAAIALG